MGITQVEYRRLVSTGNYENVTIGATATVDIASARETLAELREWVHAQLDEATQAQRERHVRQEKRWELDDLERRIEQAKEQHARAVAFLERCGIKAPDSWREDLPF